MKRLAFKTVEHDAKKNDVGVERCAFGSGYEVWADDLGESLDCDTLAEVVDFVADVVRRRQEQA